MWPNPLWLMRGQNRNPRQGQQQDNPDQQDSEMYHEPQQHILSTPESDVQQQTSRQSRPRQQPLPQPGDWTRRYQPSINSRVYGYPSSGGVLILPGYTIDLPYLGLHPSVEATRANTAEAEDAFCRRLRYLGAVWWRYPDADLDALKGRGFEEDREKASIHVCVGWQAGGGIWVLKYNENDDGNDDLSLKAQRLGSMNMHDRCRMIEELGGRFYRNPEECEDLRWNNWVTSY